MTTKRKAFWGLATVVSVVVVAFNSMPDTPEKLSPEKEAELAEAMATIHHNLHNFEINHDRDAKLGVAKMEADLKALNADEAKKAAVLNASAAIVRAKAAADEAESAIKDARQKAADAESAAAAAATAQDVVSQAEQADEAARKRFKQRWRDSHTTSPTQ